ncbi:MAG: DUF6049 family protein [Acidimicrobiia bacterium]
MTGLRNRIVVGGLIGFLVATSVVGGTTRRAGSAPGSPSIELTGQPAWTTLGDDVTFRVQVRNATPGLEVRATVYSAVLSRIAFERTLTGDRLGSRIGARSGVVDSLPVVGASRLLTIGTQDPRAPSDSQRIRLNLSGGGSAGVFPVEIELRDPSSSKVYDHFVTDIVAVRKRAAAEVPSEPLQVAWLWHVTTAPTAPVSANGVTADPSLVRDVAADGRLGRIARALGQVGDVPITLVPSPATVDALDALATPPVLAGPAKGVAARASTVLAALRTASASSLVIASAYTPINGPGLLGSGLGDAFDSTTSTGRTALETGLNAVIDHTTAGTQPLDDATLARLRDQDGTTRFIVAPTDLTAAAGADQFTPARPLQLQTPVGTFDALEVNALATDLLRKRGADALRAQQALSALSVIALEQPNRTRGVVIDTPLLWDAPPARVQAMLAGLRDHPLLQGAAVTDIFGSVQPATTNRKPYARTLAPIPDHSAPVSRRQYQGSQKEIDGLASMIGTEEPLVGALRSQLLLSLAGRTPRTGAAISRARLDSIHQAVAAIAGKVTAPASRTVTLTSRRSNIPLSVENGTHRTVRIRVTLVSQKLDFPHGSDRIVVLPPGKNKTAIFDVTTRASGTFPVLITWSSPDRGIDLQRARYTVRSSVVSGVGLILTIGAMVFLAGWWLAHWRRNRRAEAAIST